MQQCKPLSQIAALHSNPSIVSGLRQNTRVVFVPRLTWTVVLDLVCPHRSSPLPMSVLTGHLDSTWAGHSWEITRRIFSFPKKFVMSIYMNKYVEHPVRLLFQNSTDFPHWQILVPQKVTNLSYVLIDIYLDVTSKFR